MLRRVSTFPHIYKTPSTYRRLLIYIVSIEICHSAGFCHPTAILIDGGDCPVQLSIITLHSPSCSLIGFGYSAPRLY